MREWKIAIINQRYGQEVNGGSEYFTRQIAEHLNNFCEIEVLTTCALDYDTWENYYSTGLSVINGVRVRRFPVKRKRNKYYFMLVNKLAGAFHGKADAVNEHWLRQQGPYCPDLIEYIKNKKEEYQLFIFVTYLYYLTVKGISVVADKSILIPTAHDEPYIYFHIYKKVFRCPRAIIYLTVEEKKFVESVFGNNYIQSQVMGIGVEVPNEIKTEEFRRKYHIDGKYIIYAGRIDIGKKCDEMIRFFLKYKRECKENISLVLIGKAYMEIPKDHSILHLGFVEEEDKFSGIKGAEFLWMPSEFESLSIAVLEAMALERPVLVNGKCKVLKEHCINSGGGKYYNDFKTFCENMFFLLNHRETCIRMGENGRRYIDRNYTWNLVVDKYIGIFETINGK